MSASKQDCSNEDTSTYYALHVALQTMKERCFALQQRLVDVETENLKLKMKVETDFQQNSSNIDRNSRNEIGALRMNVIELTRQKAQLNDHISLIATENRQLWKRLTNLTKDGKNIDEIHTNQKDATSNCSTNGTHQNLIRSKTFTQNSPNAMLRQKMNISINSNENNMTLGDISQKILNEFIDGKNDFEKKCNEIIPTETQLPKPNVLGFGYLNEDAEIDFQNETKKCVDGMLDIKTELLRQQSDLKVALSNLRQRKVLEICSTCRGRPAKPTTADKIVETEEILVNRLDEKELLPKSLPEENLVQIDFVEQKRVADCLEKMCPMCGKIYSSSVKFDDFQEHVESHFIDDSDVDTSIERNYELISQSVGNF